MILSSDILNDTSEAFRALDLASENAAIASVNAEIQRMTLAIEAAQARCLEINSEMLDLKKPELQGMAIADALLANTPAHEVATATRQIDELREEQMGLVSAIRELRLRIEGENNKLRAIKEQARARVRALAAPIVAALLNEAEEAAGRIVEAYARLKAISVTAGNAGLAETRKASAAVAGIFSERLLVPHVMPVPDEIDAALACLANKGTALSFHRLSQIAPPSE